MREFFLGYSSIVILFLTAINLVSCALLLLSFRKTKIIMPLCMALVAFGLFYDGLIINLGSPLSNNLSLLQALSTVRYISHGVLVPLLFVICAYALTKNKKKIFAVWVFTGIMMALGLAGALATDLELTTVAGVTRYTYADTTPLWSNIITYMLSFGAVIPLIISGIVVWIKQKTPLLFLSGFFMFLFSALPPATGNFDLIFSISMIGEVLMIAFMFLYQRVYIKESC